MKKLLHNVFYKFNFLGVLNSPLKGLKLKWYFGDIVHGTPYFLPRKTVKSTIGDANKSWEELGERSKAAYENSKGKTEWVKNYVKTVKKYVPIKYFGFDFTTLGWKPKYDEYRFEWNPSISIVIFGKQLFISIIPNLSDEYGVTIDTYWECWLNYKFETDKTKSKKDRAIELFNKYSCTWVRYSNNEEIKTDHYFDILDKKYLKEYDKWKTITK